MITIAVCIWKGLASSCRGKGEEALPDAPASATCQISWVCLAHVGRVKMRLMKSSLLWKALCQPAYLLASRKSNWEVLSMRRATLRRVSLVTLLDPSCCDASVSAIP